VQGDLTTLTNVKAWLGVTQTNTDAVLQRLISQCSRMILNYLQRPSLISQTYTDVTDGAGGSHEFLDNWPVTAVSQVVVDGQVIPESVMQIGQNSQVAGWRFEAWDGFGPGSQQPVELIGHKFRCGRLNVSIAYTAGYLVAGEAQTVAQVGEAYQVTASQLIGPWAADGGVTYANGSALAAVVSSPAQGQYSVADGVYTFNAADVGQAVLLSYSFTPADLEDACINWVSERFRYRDRIGQKTKSLGGQETASYDLSDIPGYIKAQLQPYAKVLPV
jgi:hypothetical protein